MTFVEKPRFRSRRYKKEDIQQPWLVNKDKKAHFAWIFPWLGIFIGLALTVVQCYLGWVSVPQHEYCPVLMEDFSSGVLDPNVWQHEVALGGFGNGEFSMTTSDSENSFIKDGALYIKPTLQDENLIDTNNVLDLGSNCTYTSFHDCVATTNTTNGTIVNPVKSARLTTKMGPTIKYGKVEVVAKMPVGDWMWPAIWLLPVNSTYGVWPTSGEIDIAESVSSSTPTHPHLYDTLTPPTTAWQQPNLPTWRQQQVLLHLTLGPKQRLRPLRQNQYGQLGRPHHVRQRLPHLRHGMV